MAGTTEAKRLFACYYCEQKGAYDETINHCADVHPTKPLKIRRQELNHISGKSGQRTLNFNVIPDVLRQTNKRIISNAEIQTIDEDFGLGDLSLDEDFSRSPFFKRLKTSTPHKIAQQSPPTTIVSTDYEDINAEENEKNVFIEITGMLPNVIRELKNAGQLENWHTFHKLVNEGKFPMENIAFHLFMDVCKFYSLESTTAMRFNPIVKRFWRIGYCLFHGKWLNFMSGPKGLGKKMSDPDYDLLALDADNNFAVPYRTTIDSRSKSYSQEDLNPGLLLPMINALAQQANEATTYKLCVDGKKLNAGKSKTKGDIDLFGFEKPPILSEQKQTLCDEKLITESISEILETLSVRMKILLDEISETERVGLVRLLIDLLRVLGERCKEMRKTKLNKEMLLDKIKKQSGRDWRKSKYVYLISALETDLYGINSCIKDLIGVVDDISYSVAVLNHAKALFVKETNVRLDCQLNYIHLSDMDSRNWQEKTNIVKQGSDKWHSIRDTAKVTGSSLNNAIGLVSIKQQTEHFDKVVYKKKPAEPSSDVQMKMKYGSEEEINAVATLVSKVLPVFEPSLVYVEEGCYKSQIGEGFIPLVVSPDGSLRQDPISAALYGVECKCHFLGSCIRPPYIMKYQSIT